MNYTDWFLSIKTTLHFLDLNSICSWCIIISTHGYIWLIRILLMLRDIDLRFYILKNALGCPIFFKFKVKTIKLWLFWVFLIIQRRFCKISCIFFFKSIVLIHLKGKLVFNMVYLFVGVCEHFKLHITFIL